MNSIIFILVLGLNAVLSSENLEQTLNKAKLGDDERGQSSMPELEVVIPNIGIDTIIGELFPPMVTPITAVNITEYVDYSICSPESLFKNLSVNRTYASRVTCNGVVTSILPWYFDTKLNGNPVVLEIAENYRAFSWLNGNAIAVTTGAITGPQECLGGLFWDFKVFVANSQWQCATTGLTGHTLVYGVKYLTGPCKSYCKVKKGHTKLDPPTNNLGVVIS